MTAIYKIRNLINGKFYVGSSVDVRVRFQTHRRNLRKGKHHCQPLQRAWDKYGEECFKFEVVEKVATPDDLFTAENRWLDEHHGKPYCYNLSKCADAFMRGMKFSDEHKAKISAAVTGNKSSKGYKRTPEECEIIRQRARGRKNFLGRKHTEESKAKMSEASKGKQRRLGHTNSPEHRARISAANKWRKLSSEHAEKIRQRMIGTSYAKGRIVTAEMKARFEKPVVEVTTGLTFQSVNAAAEHFGMNRPNISRTLKNDAPLKRGPKKGLHFRYALPQSPE